MKIKIISFASVLVLIIAVFTALYLFFPARADIPFINTPKITPPEYAASYVVAKAVCANSVQDCDTIEFTFAALEAARKLTPAYEVKEFPEEMRTEVVFHDIGAVNTELDYRKMISSTLIDELNYEQIDKDLVVNIFRKGGFLPVTASTDKNTIKVFLPSDNSGNFTFYDEEPLRNSTVYPAKQLIRIVLALKQPLKKALIFFQGNQTEFTTTDFGPNKYELSFVSTLENDQHYKVRAIVVDSEDRVAASSWEFDAQKKVKAAQLEKDRFKYLGWWGEINTKNAAVFEEPTTQSKKLGSFSTVNTVKVLEEVQGESIKRNNKWYKIDGGMFPGAYVFSINVTPIEQPKPPTSFKVPAGVAEGEYWIDVDLTKKILTVFQYNDPVFATYAAIGRPGNPTLAGTSRVWYKLKKTRMRGGPPTVSYVYNLPNVPYVMYYRGSYAVHGTYWHDKFGSRQSAGCTNLTQGDAKFVFELTGPKVPENLNAMRPSADNFGTAVYNHY